MKSKIVQMGASDEPYEDLTEHIVIMCDREFIMQSNLRVYQPVELSNGTSAKTLAKARAVLAEYKVGVEWAQRVLAYPSAENESALKCLVALAEALEGGGDE